ncbi:MAG: histidinol-phosphate transaminase [Desulfomonilia bacterium]
MKTVEPVPWAFTIPEYIPGTSKEEIARRYGATNPIKLASNENPLGTSPKALQAVGAALTSSHIYPDPDSKDLRTAASRFFDCKIEGIIAGNGSDEIIDLICRAYLKPGDEVIIPSCTFSYYGIAARACGASVVTSPMKEHRIDMTGIKAAISPKTKAIFVANPNNPTGTYLPKYEVLYLIEKVPKNLLLIMDEAYGAFVRADDFLSTTSLSQSKSNLITIHTLSKSHGLAGLRVGFGIATTEIISTMLRIKPPFNVNILAQKAGEAALNDEAFFKKTLAHTRDSLDMLYEAFDRLGLAYVRSQTNFVLVHIGKGSKRVYEDLLKKGIITRHMPNIGLDEYIRVSIGLPEENSAFIAALKETL